MSKLDKLKFRDKKEAQAENFRKMIMAMVQDIRVILIKLADRTHKHRGTLADFARTNVAASPVKLSKITARCLQVSTTLKPNSTVGFEALYPNRYRVIKEVVKAARQP